VHRQASVAGLRWRQSLPLLHQRRRPLHLPRRLLRHHPRHHPGHHRPHQHQPVTHSIAWSMPRTRGEQTRVLGVATCTTGAAPSRSCRQCSRSCHQCGPSSLLRQPTPTIVPRASRIGSAVGQWGRRNGAAAFTGKGVQVQVADVHLSELHLRHTIALLVSQIGWPDGQYPKSSGVARTQAKVAQRLEAVREHFGGRHRRIAAPSHRRRE